jgi:CBS domain-containing protein
MTTVRQVLQQKGSEAWSVTPQATVYEALELMAAKDIGAVLVMSTDGKLVGIFSERDYARKVTLKGRTSKQATVAELMTSKVVAVTPDRTLDDVMQIMSARKIRHLPVLEGERVIGVITIGDVVKNLISDHLFTIQQLERYIVGPSHPGE